MRDAKTLFDRLGGKDSIEAVVTEFYHRMLADESVAHHFEDTDIAAQRAHQTQFLSAVAGGPVEYSGSDMETAHKGMGITDAEFDATADHLDAALREFDVPKKERTDVLAAVASYREDIVEADSTDN
ncbi:group I truncated hemoglobin [Natronocalculus amylovorans]|uniref:Group 1 truncated hemoglobin n=1 Tax=Natronocalculus amylovorans TaxID=2917812 RepID=A0AAE3G0W9_9EURY|nr:group 1 truncated hemoglobin [Natronocalculus amylovorans]MCL9817999.1 group 1 truncated hemoglobin [Natronocalculus amylovorans]